MNDFTRCVLVVALLLAAAGCFPASQDTLRTRAAFDFQCAEAALRLTELDSGAAANGQGAVFGVEGCGHRGTYVTANGSTWVRNTQE